ncbi:unnamed protein product [Vitrella brassicaformis CCMP3155]|uniref:HNH nuclease domain-containing protein n=1 Tax=Vitrella brassicaformis (strain CCMP3155) TaxID=1169540 RepID=A0A0G4FP63_VITBC|nr:unnamed protein product [Vitrella brassicaformis CCMP3155]|eukprot:CEM15617.1 unnamed protein product [Vitrella brassicaformis CCMP3155]
MSELTTARCQTARPQPYGTELGKHRRFTGARDAGAADGATAENESEEEFRLIPGFDGRSKTGAQVSNRGRVLHGDGKVSWGTLEKDGYRRVNVNKKRYAVHRLVAETFHREQKEQLIAQAGEMTLHVDHIDGNKVNNAASNLQWVTPAQHRRKTVESDLPRPRPLMSSARQVTATNRTSGEVLTFRSTMLAAKHFKISPAVFRKSVIRRKMEAHMMYPSVMKEWVFAFEKPDKIEGERFRSIGFLKHLFPEKKRLPMVSNMGRIRHVNGRVTCGTKTVTGYLRVELAGQSILVHRIVATLWRPHELARWRKEGYADDDLDVHHVDGNPANNEASNLQWMPPKEHAKLNAEAQRAKRRQESR